MLGNKRVVIIPIILSILVVLLSAFIVSAANSNIPWQTTSSSDTKWASFTGDIKNMASAVTQDLVTPLAQALLGNSALGEGELLGDALFARVLLFIVLLALVWAILSRIEFIGEHTWVLVLISIAIPIIGLRFLDASIINTILLPYSSLAIVLTILLPWAILFYGIEVLIKSSLFRRVGWIFAMVIFIGLYFTRENLGTIGFLYLLAAILAFLMIFLERVVSRWVRRAQASGYRETREDRMRVFITNEEDTLNEALMHGLDDATYNREKARIENLKRKYGIA